MRLPPREVQLRAVEQVSRAVVSIDEGEANTVSLQLK